MDQQIHKPRSHATQHLPHSVSQLRGLFTDKAAQTRNSATLYASYRQQYMKPRDSLSGFIPLAVPFFPRKHIQSKKLYSVIAPLPTLPRAAQENLRRYTPHQCCISTSHADWKKTDTCCCDFSSASSQHSTFSFLPLLLQPKFSSAPHVLPKETFVKTSTTLNIKQNPSPNGLNICWNYTFTILYLLSCPIVFILCLA